MKNILTAISALHRRLFARPWLQSSPRRVYIIGGGLLILLAGLINFEIRHQQWVHWQENPQRFFLGDTPLVSTTDAAHFLIHAENVIAGAPIDTFNASRLYPERTPAYMRQHNPDYQPPAPAPKHAPDRPTGYFDVPMPSAIIALSAEIFTDGNVGLAGNAMIAFSAFITALAIGAMFAAAGHPVEGAVAGVGLGLSSIYMGRTGIGRIDTDQMIMGFLALCLMLVLLTGRERNLARMLGYAVLTALAARLGIWWHEGTHYLMLMPVLIFISIVLTQRHFGRAVLAAAAFILAFNPIAYYGHAHGFIKTIFALIPGIGPIGLGADAPVSEANRLVFPDTFRTITEQARLDLLVILEAIGGHTAIGLIGLTGFVLWALMRPSRAVVFAPFVILGLLSVLAGRRYAFFAAPFIWFGLGWLVMTATRYLISWRPRLSAKASDFIALGVGAVAVLATAAWLHTGFIPHPAFSKHTTAIFRDLGRLAKNNAGDQGGIIATWWDYGYYAHFHSGGMATIHDGGNQTTPRTHLFARGLISHNTNELIQITKFLTTGGIATINANSTSLNALNNAIARADTPPAPLYLVLTDQMVGWAGSIATLGRFDPERGQYWPPEAINLHYNAVDLRCMPLGENKLACNHGLLDIDHGTLDGNPLISKVILSTDGYITGSEDHDNRRGYYLTISTLGRGGAPRLRLVHETLWHSAFFQLLEYGRYDQSRLELVLDHYPVGRVYRVIR